MLVMKNRDMQLDMYRGLVMIYIVCFIHVVNWLDYSREPFASLMLFEMPVIFFISGASLSVSRRKCLLENFKNRIHRVLLPYYIYSAISLVLLGLLSCVRPTDFDISRYTLGNIGRILLSIDIPQMPYMHHLWFIMPYMTIMCLFPLQSRLVDKIGGARYLLVNILLFLLVWAVGCRLNIVRESLCYNVFVIVGYCYYKKITRRVLLFVTVIAALLVACLLLYVPFCPMNGHKFPPDLLFLLYGLMMLGVLSLILGNVTMRSNKLVELWNKRGYNIYLYQNLIYYCFVVFCNSFKIVLPVGIVGFVISVFCILLLSTLFCVIFYTIECWVLKCVRL